MKIKMEIAVAMVGLCSRMAFAFQFSVQSAYEADFYVAPNGNDSEAGTFNAPFSSLERARDAVRILKSASPNKDILILLRGGDYLLTNTVVFGVEDSAATNHTITYAAYPGEQPVLGSGVPVTGWQQLSGTLPPGLPAAAGTNVWVVPAPTGIDYCSTLFDGTQQLSRARSDSFVPLAGGSTTEIYFPSGLIPGDASVRGMELRIIPTRPWNMDILPISAVDTPNNMATISVQASYPLNEVTSAIFPDGTAWIENAVEFLNKPGEWAFDAQTRLIYFWPVSGRPSSKIVAPALTELVRVEGIINAAAPVDIPVKGLVFRGLAFTHADHLRWPEGQDPTGWKLRTWEMFDRATAMLRFRGAEDCVVEECEFYNSGASAIRADLHAQRIRIARNHIHDVGGAGVILAGYGPGTKDVNHHNEIVDNEIHNVGQVMWHSSGIFIWQSGYNRIAHNYVHDVPYNGMTTCARFKVDRERLDFGSYTIRWSEIDAATGNASQDPLWGADPWSYGSWEQREPFLHGRFNVIEYNDIERCQQVLSDGNGIGLIGAGAGNEIRYNLIHGVDTRNLCSAIRCDDSQHGTVIQSNIIYDNAADGIVSKGVNTIINNIVYGLHRKTSAGILRQHIFGYLSLPYGDVAGSVIQQNIFFATEDVPVFRESPPDTNGVPYHQYGAATLRECDTDYNLYFSTFDANWGTDHLLEQRQYGIETNSISADPLFVNPAAGDFRLRVGSPAFGLGFLPVVREVIEEDFESPAHTSGNSVSDVNSWIVTNEKTDQHAKVALLGSAFSGGSQSVRYFDHDASTMQLKLEHTVSLMGNSAKIRFDYRSDGSASQTPVLRVYDNGDTTLGILLNIMTTTGTFRNSSGGWTTLASGLTPGTWYRVEINIADITAVVDTFDLTVTEEGGAVGGIINATDLSFNSNIDSIGKIQFGMNNNPVGSGADIYLDNIRVLP